MSVYGTRLVITGGFFFSIKYYKSDNFRLRLTYLHTMFNLLLPRGYVCSVSTHTGIAGKW